MPDESTDDREVRPTRIFISHSSDGGASLVRGIEQILTRDGYEVFLDAQAIQTADQWRSRIHAALAQCDAAAIVFSRKALESPWVLKEATILEWRREHDRQFGHDFKLVPVLLPDISRAELNSGVFGPLHLGDIHSVRSETPAEIAGIIRRVVANAQIADNPFDKLTGAIASLLRGVDASELERACRKLFNKVGWAPGEDRRAIFAEALARRMLSDGVPRLESAIEVIKEIHRVLPPGSAQKIVNLVAPYWVDAEAAGPLAVLAARQDRPGNEARHAVLSNAQHYDFTPRMYVDRAYPVNGGDVFLITVDRAAADASADYVTHCIRAYIRERVPSMKDAKDDRLDAKVNRTAKVLVLVPDMPADPSLLVELERRYPRVTFIFWDPNPPANLTTPFPEVKYLIPQLGLGEEDQALADWEDAELYLANVDWGRA